MKKLILAAIMLALPALSHAAVFTDNFDSDTTALNKTGFSKGWTVNGGGAVDLIGDNPALFNFPTIVGHGNYVDLDGSNGTPGGFEKILALDALTQYTLSFDLAGSQRNNSTEGVQVIFGTSSANYTLNSNDLFSTYTLSFTTNAATNYQILFQNTGADGSPNIGALLDNVSVTAVPEPETYMLMLGGLGLIGFAARRRKA